MSLDKEIFKGKTLSDLFGEIYDNSKETKGQVKSLINELKPLIENIGDATLIVPMIKEYMDIGGDFDFGDLQDLLEESVETDKELEAAKAAKLDKEDLEEDV